MGFNTVVLILNDHISSIREAPHAVTWAITNPPISTREQDIQEWKEGIWEEAKKHGESAMGLIGGLTVIPSFHMDDVHYLYAGRNTLRRLQARTFGIAESKSSKDAYKVDGKSVVNTVTLTLPKWS